MRDFTGVEFPTIKISNLETVETVRSSSQPDEPDASYPVSRRRFLSSLLPAVASFHSAPLLLKYFQGERGLLAEAAELSREAVSVDFHCHPNSVGGPHFPEIDPDLPANMRAGDLDVGVFAARGDLGVIRRDSSGRRYEYRKAAPAELFRGCQEQVDKIIEATKTGKLAIGRSPGEIVDAKRQGLPCAVLAIEGGDPLEGELSRLDFFYQRGVRVLQLVHYRINELGDIQTEPPRHKGLTAFGRQVAKEMNRLGMVIDTAHCSSDTLNDVLTESRRPVIFSHTGPHALRRFKRHLPDKDMQAIARKGGVIGIWPLLGRRDTFATFLNEIDYAKNLVGADHVGVATDLYGLRDATSIPTHKEFSLIPAGLLKRGYAANDVAKIIGENFMRVFREVTLGR